MSAGKSVSERRAELEDDRFFNVRQLVTTVYKKLDANGNPTDQPFMTYEDTLNKREDVIEQLLQHEIRLGLISPDLQPSTQGQQMTQQNTPPMAPPMAPLATQAGPNPPMMAPPPAPSMMAPPMSAPMVQPPAMAPNVVPMAPPQQAAPPTQTPQPQAAPTEAPKRRGRPPKNAAAATPAAAPMAPPSTPAAAPATFQAPQVPGIPGVVPTAPQPMAPPVAVPAAPAPVVQQSGASPELLEKLDSYAKALDGIYGVCQELEKTIQQVREENRVTLVALHHLHAVHAQLGTSIAGKDLSGFEEHMKQFLPK
jgi:hypothetical protein